MVRWLEREGFDLACCTNLDTHARPALLLNCSAWLSIGHDEYWSWPMRQHVEAARDAGVHLGFFSANSAYWQVRFEPSAASGTAGRVMVCHKRASHDPAVKGRFDKSSRPQAWGLDDYSVPAVRSSRCCPAAQQITRNVPARMVLPRG